MEDSMTTIARHLAAALVVFSLSALSPKAAAPQGGHGAMSGTVYGFTMKMNDGSEKSLADYKGKVLLLVNTASECGFTPQYQGLEELYERYKERGFEVLAFPANNFGSQEPGTDAQIKSFCSTKYHVTFPLFAKSDVKGPGINPLYKFLTAEAGFDGDITWNFNKFLVDRQGKVVARFDSKVTPLSKELTSKVEELLSGK
jgi:glutathione peroxidase